MHHAIRANQSHQGLRHPAPREVLGRLREIHVHFGMFDFAVYCVVGPANDLSAYIAWRRGHSNLVPDREASRGRYYPGRGEYGPIIWIPRRPRSPREHGTLSHEVCHVVREMYDWVGMQLDESTEETFCHAVGFAVTTILTELRKRK